VQAGFLPTALFISAVLTMLATATFADRIGAKRMNVFGVGFALASNLLFAIGPTYETLLLAKAVGGIGSGMAFVGGVRYIAGLYSGARSHFGQGLYGAGYPLGSALGLQLMPPLALAFGGWRGEFAASSTLLLPVVEAAGVNALHFGIIMAVNLSIGLYMPPFGLNLFAARAIFNVPMGMIYRGVLPFVVVNFLALLVITYVPAISMVLIGGAR